MHLAIEIKALAGPASKLFQNLILRLILGHLFPENSHIFRRELIGRRLVVRGRIANARTSSALATTVRHDGLGVV